jgi:hypothetical protein
MENLTGRRFGRLVVTAFHGRGKYDFLWECQCDCGTIKTIQSKLLKSGKTRSCGCLREEVRRKKGKKTSQKARHGHCRKPRRSGTYDSWAHMKDRCLNPKNKDFASYGKRGITVCDRWLKFDNFLQDMGIKPDGLTLERTNNRGNYEPGNCEWVSRKVQANNRRRKSIQRRAQVGG